MTFPSGYTDLLVGVFPLELALERRVAGERPPLGDTVGLERGGGGADGRDDAVGGRGLGGQDLPHRGGGGQGLGARTAACLKQAGNLKLQLTLSERKCLFMYVQHMRMGTLTNSTFL